MAINFPSSPTLNYVYSSSCHYWRWDGTSWNSCTSTKPIIQISASYAPTASYVITHTAISSSVSITSSYAESGSRANNAISASYALNGGTSGDSIIIVGNGTNSTLRSGSTNCANGNYSTVFGGLYNTGSGTISTIAGGLSNVASGNCSGILGGHDNNTCNLTDAFIIGSNLNATANCTTFVNNLCVTRNLLATVTCVTSASNSLNFIYSNAQIISGSGDNSIYQCGVGNSVTGYHNASIGGTSNIIPSYSISNSIILGGQNNKICTTFGNTDYNNSILGGQSNVFCNYNNGGTTTGYNNSILGGCSNKICNGDIFLAGNGYNNSILGGQNNVFCMINGCNNSILGGHDNKIYNLCDTFIVGSNITATVGCTTYVNSLALQVVATPPTSPVVGMLIYSGSTMKKLFYYNGTNWVCAGI